MLDRKGNQAANALNIMCCFRPQNCPCNQSTTKGHPRLADTKATSPRGIIPELLRNPKKHEITKRTPSVAAQYAAPQQQISEPTSDLTPDTSPWYKTLALAGAGQIISGEAHLGQLDRQSRHRHRQLARPWARHRQGLRGARREGRPQLLSEPGARRRAGKG